MCSEKQTQIGQPSLNLWEPRWTLTTKISKSFELSAKVPRGQPAGALSAGQRTTQAAVSVRAQGGERDEGGRLGMGGG